MGNLGRSGQVAAQIQGLVLAPGKSGLVALRSVQMKEGMTCPQIMIQSL